jgi:hypothetical protein
VVCFLIDFGVWCCVFVWFTVLFWSHQWFVCLLFFFILREFSDGFLSCFDFLVSSFCLLVVKYGVIVVVAFHVSLLRLMCLLTSLSGERYTDSQTERERERERLMSC